MIHGILECEYLHLVRGKTKTYLCCVCLDTLGLHRVENSSHTEKAVSLHLYSPPFDLCHWFDERTSTKHTCRITFTNMVRSSAKMSCMHLKTIFSSIWTSMLVLGCTVNLAAYLIETSRRD